MWELQYLPRVRYFSCVVSHDICSDTSDRYRFHRMRFGVICFTDEMRNVCLLISLWKRQKHAKASNPLSLQKQSSFELFTRIKSTKSTKSIVQRLTLTVGLMRAQRESFRRRPLYRKKWPATPRENAGCIVMGSVPCTSVASPALGNASPMC